MSAEGSIVYYRTPKATPVFKLSAAGFFFLGVVLVIGGPDLQAGLLARLVAVFSFACFGVCAWFSARRLKRRHGVYAVNHDGFCLVGPYGKTSLVVDWKEVQGVGVSDFGYGNALTFAFRDPDAVKARMTAEQRKSAEENAALGIPTLIIPQNAFDTPVDEIRNVSTRFFFSAG